MPTPVSALDRSPFELIQEVSPSAIKFYADELSGIHLPDDFRQQHSGNSDVKHWKPEDRLHGKFGRFVVHSAEADEPKDLILMGTTIGLGMLDHRGYMLSLRHYDFYEKLREMFVKGTFSQGTRIQQADYGGTSIALAKGGMPESLHVSGGSIDFGRARAEGRQQTCDVFARLLDGEIEVINADPEPRDYEDIVENDFL